MPVKSGAQPCTVVGQHLHVRDTHDHPGAQSQAQRLRLGSRGRASGDTTGVRTHTVPYEYCYFLIYEDFLYYLGGKF